MMAAMPEQCSRPTETPDKALATLKARLALRGYELSQLADGTFLVSRWNLSRALAGLDCAARFAKQVGA